MSIAQIKEAQNRILGRTIGREISPMEAEEVTGGTQTISIIGHRSGAPTTYDNNDNDKDQ